MLLLGVWHFLAFLDIFYKLLSGFSIGPLQHAYHNKDMVHNKVRDELPGGLLYDMGNHTSTGAYLSLRLF
jgi:hypothetical protein